MTAGASVGVLVLALAVQYYSSGSVTSKVQEGRGAFATKVTVITLCFAVVVLRVVIPFAVLRRAGLGQDEPVVRRVLMVL